ncbi:MAG: PEP/pyruvate-binding domain-containing protein [Methanolobus sp.]|nr:PEP/pyruvate-binding domain-containing protein [Methanolobus sp.]
MKRYVIDMEEIETRCLELIGSKALSLHKLMNEDLQVPPFTCISTAAYERYLDSTHIRDSIIMELSRKDMADMRWEEMWDTSLRIRNMFLNTAIPEELEKELLSGIGELLYDKAVVVRSSAPGEDSGNTSFAGLHESYVNVRGPGPIIEHVRLVWASLWSDAALLYREELGLDVGKSGMAVIIQELMEGQASGIIFSRSPNDNEQMIIEAVHGLNKGLVDGDLEPDRWTIDRKDGAIIDYQEPSGREKIVHLVEKGTVLESMPDELAQMVPLDEKEVHRLYQIAMILERSFEGPQDIEWTIKDEDIYVLQSRPITTGKDEEKVWYLSLRRTVDDLQKLRRRVEHELIPQMISDYKALQTVDLQGMDDNELGREILRRKGLYESWKQRYTDEFIPFAHGMRLFAQVYNDVIRPSDPYEFMELLSGSGLLSMKRNEELKRLADMLRQDSALMDRAKNGKAEGAFLERIEDFTQDYMHAGIFKSREELVGHIVELASGPDRKEAVKRGREEKYEERDKEGDKEEMENSFISAFSDSEQAFARELLDMGRTSYRLRDDDNIHLGRIEHQYIVSLNEARDRIAIRVQGFDTNIDTNTNDYSENEILKALNDDEYLPVKGSLKREEDKALDIKEHVRQIQGQPAGQGLVTGIARVIVDKHDLFKVRSGEILVCDAIDPNMTFVVPLVSGIVERRGGMLIHGAIIAREYGIPCVTGIPDATGIIRNGDELTVDGYLGIVTIRRK